MRRAVGYKNYIGKRSSEYSLSLLTALIGSTRYCTPSIQQIFVELSVHDSSEPNPRQRLEKLGTLSTVTPHSNCTFDRDMD